MSKGNYAAMMGNTAGESYSGWRFIQGTTANIKYFHFSCNNRKLGSSYSVTVSNVDTIVGNRFDVHMEYGMGYVISKGVKYSLSPPSDGTEVSTNNIAIGNSAPTTGGSATNGVHRFYYFRIYKQNKLIRDYIPVVRKSDSKAGFYDLVNNTFNPSIGSRDFVAGYSE